VPFIHPKLAVLTRTIQEHHAKAANSERSVNNHRLLTPTSPHT
jgi:hypothetical protein